MMLRMGFAQMNIVMLCVRTLGFYIAVNNSFDIGLNGPEHGLRQGVLLSPYLFILCNEGLSSLFSHALVACELHDYRIARSSPSITHSQFSNDSFFFYRETVMECAKVKHLFIVYI